jgi:hypothetical protein
MEQETIRLSPEQAAHEHHDLRWDWKADLFICGGCGAKLCIPELSEVMLLSAASE